MLNIVLIIFFISVCSSEQIKDIYSSSIYKQFQAGSSSLYFEDLQLAKDVGLLIVRQGNRQISIIDENNQHQIIFTYQFQEDVLGQAIVTRDSKYFIFNVSNKLTIFTYDIHKIQFTQIYQDSSSSQQIINEVNLNQKQDKVYVIKDSIDLYIISLHDFQIQKCQFEQQQVVISFIVSSDDSWICLFQDAVGLKFYQIVSQGQNQIQLRLACENVLVNAYSYLLIKNDTILITQNYWIGFSIFDITELVQQIKQGQSNLEMKPLLLNWWPVTTQAPYSNNMDINQEQTFLFEPFRSVGFYIFDIQNPSQPQIVQLIQIQEDIIQIIQSYKNPYIYLQTKKRIIIYKQVEANFQNDYPNLFNKHASVLSSVIDTSESKQIKMLSDNSHILVCCSSQGLHILKLNLSSIFQPLEVVSQINYSISFESFLIFSNSQFLILSVKDSNGFYFDIYDLSNLSSPQRVQRILAESQVVNSMALSKDETLFIIQSNNDLIFYDFSKNSFQQLTKFNISPSLVIQQSSIAILNGFPYILVLIQEQQIIALQISKLSEPQISSTQESLGAVFGIQGTYQSNFFFLADGQQGISIIDLRQLPNIVIITSISLNGYQVSLSLLQNDNYIICSLQSGGQIALINILNINEPYLMSQTQFQNESSVATEITQDLQHLFVLNSLGIRIFPIKASLLINFEFSLIQNTDTGQQQQQQTISNAENIILKVGQYLIVTLTSIYPENNNVITNAYIAQNNNFKTLPSWLSFDNHLNQLQINVTKESLTGLIQKNNTSEQVNYNNVVFVTKMQLQETSFIYQDEITGSYIINDVQSKQIFWYYKNYNILNSQNQISDQFCQNEQFNLPNLSKMTISQDGNTYIRSVLQSSVVYSPLKLSIQNSLIVNFTDTFQIINSISKIASMSIYISKTKGKFVNKNYPGVITSISKEQDMLQLQGDIINLNQILAQQIQVYFYNNTYLQSQVEVIIDDKINYQYGQVFLFQDIQSIFQIKKSIQIQSTQSLQDQVNRIYSDSIIYIDELNTIQLSSNTYENSDFKDLTFEAFEIKGGNLEPISAQIDSVNFFPSQLMFEIKPQISDFSKEFCFSVNATDSYSWAEGQFCVKASGISMILFLNWMFKYLGSTLFFLGLLKYWYLLFNLILAKKNKYKLVQLSSGEEFIQKIILVNDSYIISKMLFKKFKQYIKTQKQQKNSIQNSQRPNILCQSILNREADYSQDNSFLPLQNDKAKKLQNLIKNTNNKLDQCLNSKYKCSYEEFEQYVNHHNWIDKQKFFADLEQQNLPVYYNKKKIFPQQFKKDFTDEDSIIFNCLYDSIGLSNPQKSRLFPNSGESIHLLDQDIKKIEVFTKKKFVKNQLCKQQYVPLLSRKNQNLPIWLNMSIGRQIITIHGKIPKSNHYEELKICIINNNNCIVREHTIQIIQNKEQNLQQLGENFEDSQNQNKVHFNFKTQSLSLKNSTFKDKQIFSNTQLQKQNSKSSIKNTKLLNQNNQVLTLLQEQLTESDQLTSGKNNNQKKGNKKSKQNFEMLEINIFQVNKKRLFHYFLITNCLLYFTISQVDQEIYIPTIFKSFDSASNELYFKNIAIAKQVGLIYFKQGEKTINVLDENNSFNIVCTYQTEYPLNDRFLVTSNGLYLVVILNNILTILSYNSQVKQFSTVFKDTQQSQFNMLSLNQKEDKIYLIRDQINFQIISLVDLTIVQGTLNNQWKVLDMHISEDEKWLCISANTQGLFFYHFNISNNKIIQFTNISSCNKVNFYQFIIFKNDNYIIGQDYLKGISIFDLTSFPQQIELGNANILLEPLVLNWWMIQNGIPYSSTLEINKDQTLVYVGARSLGIYAIDITNIQNPAVFQLVQIQEDIFQLCLSYNLSYLYLSTKKSIFVYQKDKANLQMNYPNMYNKHQSTLSSILNTPYGWRSLLLKDDKTLIVTCSNFGVIIAQFNQTSIQQPLQVLSNISYPFLTYNDNIMLFRNETFLLVPVQDPAGYILDVYDISNKTSPQIAWRIASSTSAYIYSMSKSLDETLFACQNLNQLAFYQISGYISFNLISVFDIPQSQLQNQSNDMVILNGFPYIILLFRTISIMALDITSLQKPFIASQIVSLGAEQIVQGTYQKNYCFVADGLQGVSVIDLAQLPNIVIVSNVQISGYTNFLNVIINDQLVITSQLSGGESALASFSPIQLPQLISQLQYKDDFAAASSVSSNLNFLFVINAGGVRTIPIKANVFIHYEFQQIIKDNTGAVNLIRLNQQDQILLVGQTIQITLNPLYPTQGSQVTNAYFVRDGILYDLPSWMIFDIYQSTLTLSITKDSLSVINADSVINNNNNNNNNITKQTVVFVTKLCLTQSSFVFNSEITNEIVISEDMSQQIFLAYKNIGVINHMNQISDQFAEDETFTPPNIDGINLTDEAIIKIQRVLQMSLTYSPVYLLLQKSLEIDFTQDNNYIQSYSPTASILFIVNQTDGKFVNILYSSVVTSLSQKQDQIQLQGNINSLNQLLQQQIQIYLYDKNNTNITIQINVSDGINNDFSAQYSLQQLQKIFQVKKVLSINPENKLQNQVENQYPDSQIAINTQVDIEFSFNTYSNASFSDLQFQAYYIENDQYQALTAQQSVIQFTPQQFKFNIKTSIKDFGRIYCLGVNATDSYSWVVDSFCVTATVITFEVFLNIFIQVLGPLIFIFGIFKYWNQFFNILFSNKNQLGKKLIEEHKQFVLKFIVVDHCYLIGQKLFNEFVKNIPEKKISQKLAINGLSNQYSCQLKSNILKYSLQQFEAQENSDQLKEDTDISDFFFSKKQNAKAQSLIKKTAKILNNKSFSIKEISYRKFQIYITDNQTVDVKAFIKDLLISNKPIKFEGKVIYPKDFQYELNDSGSILYNCLSGLLYKQIIKQNKRTFVVYQFIKQIAQLCNTKSSNQWTQFISESNHVLKQNVIGEEQIIPQVQIKTQNLMKIFNILLKSMNKNILINLYELNSQFIYHELGVYLELILDNIISDAIGIASPTNSSLYPNSGESIHLLEHQIKKVQAYVKSKNSKLQCLMKLLKMDYQPLFSRKNQQLPSWLKIKIEKQLITLYGIAPSRKDYKQIKIQIFDNKDCIIRQANFKIIKQHDQNLEQNAQRVLSIPSSEINSPIIGSSKDDTVENFSPLKANLFESIQTEIDTNKACHQNKEILKKKNFKLILNEQQNNQEQNQEIKKKQISQLKRTIHKHINPLLYKNQDSII
ncbi:hypothetical protein ABPG74_012026 [Tetrahymena malaccensis]